MNEIRLLRADEIDCRIGQCNENGLTLLLYKDARCDMTILDETFGSLYWKRSHSRDNANCTVSVWNSELGEWISKEDTGTESNTEAEKGLASDSFKRACVNFGIGRELYTAPFIWIGKDKCNITQGRNGKPACYDKFVVEAIEYENRAISSLAIRNTKTGKIVFEKYPAKKPAPRPPQPQQTNVPDVGQMRRDLSKLMNDLCNGNPADIRTGISFWTNKTCSEIADIPDDMLPDVLITAETYYRKHRGADYDNGG